MTIFSEKKIICKIPFRGLESSFSSAPPSNWGIISSIGSGRVQCWALSGDDSSDKQRSSLLLAIASFSLRSVMEIIYL